MKKSTKKSKINKYPNGGRKALDVLGNLGAGITDTALSAIGLSNVVPDSAYQGGSAQDFRNVSNFTGGVAKAALPIVANTLVPGSGKLIKMGTQATGMFNPQDPNQDPNQQNLQNMGQGLGQLGLKAAEFFPMGGNNGQPNVELEKQETFQTPNGQVGQVDGPTHNDGGVPMNLPNNTRIFSDRLKNKSGKTYAEESSKFKTEKWEKLLKTSKDSFTQNAAKRMLEITNKKLDDLFQEQESYKQEKGLNDDGTKMKNGGLSRERNYGSSEKPYPSVESNDFAGGNRSYPIPTKADAVDALRLAGLHGRSDVRAKVYAKYPSLKKPDGGVVVEPPIQQRLQNINPKTGTPMIQMQRMDTQGNPQLLYNPDGTPMMRPDFTMSPQGNPVPPQRVPLDTIPQRPNGGPVNDDSYYGGSSALMGNYVAPPVPTYTVQGAGQPLYNAQTGAPIQTIGRPPLPAYLQGPDITPQQREAYWKTLPQRPNGGTIPYYGLNINQGIPSQITSSIDQVPVVDPGLNLPPAIQPTRPAYSQKGWTDRFGVYHPGVQPLPTQYQAPIKKYGGLHKYQGGGLELNLQTGTPEEQMSSYYSNIPESLPYSPESMKVMDYALNSPEYQQAYKNYQVDPEFGPGKQQQIPVRQSGLPSTYIDPNTAQSLPEATRSTPFLDAARKRLQQTDPNYVAASVGNFMGPAYDIYRGLKGGDDVNFERLNPSMVDYSQSRELTKRNLNTQFRDTRKAIQQGTGGGAGNYLANVANAAANRDTTIGDVNVRSIEAEQNANAGIRNQAGQFNAQVQQAESIARQQEKDIASNTLSTGLYNAGKATSQLGRDNQMKAYDPIIRSLIATGDYRYTYDNKGKPLGVVHIPSGKETKLIQ